MVIAICVQKTERDNANPWVLSTKLILSFPFVLSHLTKAKDTFPYLPPRKMALWIPFMFGIHIDWKNMSSFREILYSSSSSSVSLKSPIYPKGEKNLKIFFFCLFLKYSELSTGSTVNPSGQKSEKKLRKWKNYTEISQYVTCWA